MNEITQNNPPSKSLMPENKSVLNRLNSQIGKGFWKKPYYPHEKLIVGSYLAFTEIGTANEQYQPSVAQELTPLFEYLNVLCENGQILGKEYNNYKRNPIGVSSQDQNDIKRMCDLLRHKMVLSKSEAEQIFTLLSAWTQTLQVNGILDESVTKNFTPLK